MDFTTIGWTLLGGLSLAVMLGVGFLALGSAISVGLAPLVRAYEERTKMIGAQFAESRRVQARLEQAERERPKVSYFDMGDAYAKQAEAEAERIRKGTAPVVR